MKTIDYAKKSLIGLWVGDCIGNLGQLYFVHDILKALESGMAKFGGKLDKFQKQFQYSDDTEEAIVLINHLISNDGQINKDDLAMEFAKRYMERDPDGEIYGYGLNTRKVLRDIYDGIPWNEANKIIPKSEGMPSHIDNLVKVLSDGTGIKDAFKTVTKELSNIPPAKKAKEGSCGNGSAMRVAPLGAYFGGDLSAQFSICKILPEEVVKFANESSLPTHCHPEGIAGAIATALASYFLVSGENFQTMSDYWPGDGDGIVKDDIGKSYIDQIIKYTPDSEVKKGLDRARNLSYDTPLGKVIEILGNGTHVTCQDTVPFCCYMVAKAICRYNKDDRYEKAIIETSMGFGDVDTNCAIVGGILGTINPPPDKWIKFCEPMDGVL